MTRASVVNDGDDAVASQYEALRDGYAIREQVHGGYTVFEQDAVYYADHCFGSGNDFSGANANTVLQSTIDALTYGEVIFIRRASSPYMLTGLTVTKSGIIFFGEGDSYDGSTGTVLKLSDNANSNIFTCSGTIANLGFYGLHFEGNRGTQTNGHGIHLTNTDYVRIIDCGFNQMKDAAIFLDTGCQVAWVNRCHMKNIEVNWGAFGAITMNSSDHIIRGNDITSLKNGIYCSAGNNQLVNNQVYVCTNQGIYIFSADGNDVSRNRCNTNQQSGIALFNSTNSTINGNRCFNNDMAVSGNDGGIRLWGTSTENVLTGNRCWDTQGVKTQAFGISMAVNSDNNCCTGNQLQGNKTNSLVDGGAGNLTQTATDGDPLNVV